MTDRTIDERERDADWQQDGLDAAHERMVWRHEHICIVCGGRGCERCDPSVPVASEETE